MKFFTTTLTSGSLTINQVDSVLYMSVRGNPDTTGTFTVSGNMIFKGIPSTPIQLDTGAGINYFTYSVASPIDGVTITWLSGNVDVTLGF